MDDYIRRDKALAELHLDHKDVIYIDKQAAAERIRKIPYIDLVRCEECIDNSINCDGEENWCLRFGYDVEPSDFCSYGERKESE